MRILLDTNIIISGLLSAKGPPGILVRAWLRGHFDLVTSQQQLNELTRVLSYDHLKNRIHPLLAQEVLGNIDVRAIIATDLPTVDASPDPDDNAILATAIAGEADLIISGDRPGILNLGAIEGIPTTTARDALNRLKIEE